MCTKAQKSDNSHSDISTGVIIEGVSYFLLVRGWLQTMAQVFLWTTPRSLSTAMERSIRQLDTVEVLYEPHSSALHYQDGSLRPHPTAHFQSTRERILLLARKLRATNSHLFIREMAYRCFPEPYVTGEFTKFKHTFLIRHPVAVGTSLQKVWSVYDEDHAQTPFHTPTIGFEELWRMYEAVSTIDPYPLIITADDLLSYPR